MYDTANFFAILPAAVRYNAKLTPRAVLLYAALTSLAQSDGEAYASNDYLMRVLDISERTVVRLLRELEAEKFISIRYEYVGSTREIARRLIRISPLAPLLDLHKTQALYAVIPSHILCNTTLSVQAKILYAEISAATPTDGFCSQSAAFFAELLNASEPTVRRWIKELQDADAVRVEMEYRGDTREIRRRRIYLTAAAEIAEKRAEMCRNDSEPSCSDSPLIFHDEAESADCGRNRGVLIFDTTSDEQQKIVGNRRENCRKPLERLRL